MAHPWFQSQAPKNGGAIVPSAMENKEANTPSNYQLLAPIQDADDIDIEIVNSLTLLGWGIEQEIVNALTSSEYHILLIFLDQIQSKSFINYLTAEN